MERMPTTWMHAALRILACYRERLSPNPEDISLLSDSAAERKFISNADELAVYVIERELTRRKLQPPDERRPAGSDPCAQGASET